MSVTSGVNVSPRRAGSDKCRDVRLEQGNQSAGGYRLSSTTSTASGSCQLSAMASPQTPSPVRAQKVLGWEVQRRLVTNLRSHSWHVIEPGPGPTSKLPILPPYPVLWKFHRQIPLAFKVRFPGDSRFFCQIPRLGSLMWGLEPSEQWGEIFGIIVLRFVAHLPGGYGIWFYCDCIPPAVWLWLFFCP